MQLVVKIKHKPSGAKPGIDGGLFLLFFLPLPLSPFPIPPSLSLPYPFPSLSLSSPPVRGRTFLNQLRVLGEAVNSPSAVPGSAITSEFGAL